MDYFSFNKTTNKDVASTPTVIFNPTTTAQNSNSLSTTISFML